MKKKIIALTMAIATMSSVGAFAMNKTQSNTVTPKAGTLRGWSATLPHNYGNVYFPNQVKQTNGSYATISLSSMKGTRQVNGWINYGSSSSPKRCSSIVNMTTTGFNYQPKYSSHSSKGSSVFLGVENGQKTTVSRDKASGFVDYN